MRIRTIVYFLDPTGKCVAQKCHGHNFGLKAAVRNFSRQSWLLACMAITMTAAVVAVYIDDYCLPEPLMTIGRFVPGAPTGLSYPGSSQAGLRACARLLDYHLSDAKSEPYSSRCTSIGATSDLSQIHLTGRAYMWIRESTRLQVIDICQRSRAWCPPEAARAIFFRCQYVLSLGPLHRGLLQPVMTVMNDTSDRYDWAPGPDLATALDRLTQFPSGRSSSSIIPVRSVDYPAGTNLV